MCKKQKYNLKLDKNTIDEAKKELKESIKDFEKGLEIIKQAEEKFANVNKILEETTVVIEKADE